MRQKTGLSECNIKKSFVILYLFGHVKKELFSILPAETCVRYGFSVNSAFRLLISLNNKTLNHNTAHKSFKGWVYASALKHLFYYTWLLRENFAGVGVIYTYNNKRINKVSLIIHVGQKLQVLIMIIWKAFAMLCYISSNDSVGKRIAMC